MRKQLLVSAAALAVGVIALAGCTAAEPDSPAGGDVVMWMYPVIRDEAKNAEFWDAAEEAFAEANPGMTLDVQMQTFEKRDEQISTAIAAGTGPDIVMITPDQLSTYKNIDGLLPVDAAIEASRDAFFAGGLSASEYSGEQFGVPLFFNSTAVAYNTAVFEAAGIEELPRTWDEILEAAPLLAANGVAVMDYSGSPESSLNNTFYPILWQAGGSVFTEDGSDVAFDNREGRAALEFLVELNAVGGLPVDAATKTIDLNGSAMVAGTVGLRYLTTPPDLTTLRTALGEETVELGLPLTGEVQVTYANPGMLALTVLNDEADRAAAIAAIEFMTTADFIGSFNAVSGTFPSRSDVAVPENPDNAIYVEALEFAIPGEIHPHARQVMSILAPHIQSALRGTATVEEALAAAAAEARALLEREG